MSERAVCRRVGMGYTGHTALDRGEVFTLHGSRSDDRLVELSYCSRLPDDVVVVVCGEQGCKREFADQETVEMHRFQRHGVQSERQRAAAERTRREEAERRTAVKTSEPESDPSVVMMFEPSTGIRRPVRFMDGPIRESLT